LARILPNPPPNVNAENAFIELWDHGRFSELVNILPTASILNDGSSSYSDGVIMGEAYLAGNNWRPNRQLFFTRRGENGTDREINNINAGGVVLSAESFVRLGHVSPHMFWQTFNDLNAIEQTAFRNLVAGMLALINVNGQPLSAANNLPNF
jgi:hypothetical protein